jgi:hypothetical protein
MKKTLTLFMPIIFIYLNPLFAQEVIQNDSVRTDSTEIMVKDIFVGKWKKEDSKNPIDPTFFHVTKNDREEYRINFSNEDFYVDASLISNILKGKNMSGNFVIEVISENPTVLSYSDDGRGHFEPVRNERFIISE